MREGESKSNEQQPESKQAAADALIQAIAKARRTLSWNEIVDLIANCPIQEGLNESKRRPDRDAESR